MKQFVIALRCASSVMTLGIALGAVEAHAGAWTMEKGKMYNRFAFNYYTTDRVYDNDGDSKKMPLGADFRDINLNWYEEYGVTDKVTILSSVYYKWLESEDDFVKKTSNGPGDLDIGVRYKLYDGPVVASIQGIYKYGKLYGKEAPEIGNRQDDLEFRLLVGKSLWPFPGYVNLEAGYRFRNHEPADEIRYLVEAGANFSPKLYGRMKLDGILGMKNGSYHETSTDFSAKSDNLLLFMSGLEPPVADTSSVNLSSLTDERFTNPTIATEYDVIKLDFTLGYQLKESLGVEVQYTPVIYGENTSKGATASIALTYTW
ncbi:MAG: hypothetical protein K6360_06710 [Deltaproteobacteria bacterium]